MNCSVDDEIGWKPLELDLHEKSICLNMESYTFTQTCEIPPVVLFKYEHTYTLFSQKY